MITGINEVEVVVREAVLNLAEHRERERNEYALHIRQADIRKAAADRYNAKITALLDHLGWTEEDLSRERLGHRIPQTVSIPML